MLAANGRICGVIDWGDISRGDRATDLAATWLLFLQAGSQEQVLKACRSVSAETWYRARGWALLLAVVLLEAADPTELTTPEASEPSLCSAPEARCLVGLPSAHCVLWGQMRRGATPLREHEVGDRGTLGVRVSLFEAGHRDATAHAVC